MGQDLLFLLCVRTWITVTAGEAWESSWEACSIQTPLLCQDDPSGPVWWSQVELWWLRASSGSPRTCSTPDEYLGRGWWGEHHTLGYLWRSHSLDFSPGCHYLRAVLGYCSLSPGCLYISPPGFYSPMVNIKECHKKALLCITDTCQFLYPRQ